jgi:hypothetical protein
VLTTSTAVVALLSLMYSTDEVPRRAVGLFGSLFVATRQTSTGATDVSMGVAHPAALVVIFGLWLAGLVLTLVIHQALQQYRADLIAARAAGT